MVASHAVNRATVLGRSSRLGLAEASRSEPLAPRPTALPHDAVLGAAAAALRCRRVCTTYPLYVMMLSMPSHHHRVRTSPLHLCAVASPVRVASAARTWVSHRRHAIYGTAARGPHWSGVGTRCP